MTIVAILILVLGQVLNLRKGLWGHGDDESYFLSWLKGHDNG